MNDGHKESFSFLRYSRRKFAIYYSNLIPTSGISVDKPFITDFIKIVLYNKKKSILSTFDRNLYLMIIY